MNSVAISDTILTIDSVLGRSGDVEVDNQRQVIRGDTRKRRAHRRSRQHLYVVVDEHVIDAKEWCVRGERCLPSGGLQQTLSVPELGGETAVGARRRTGIEVPQEDDWPATVLAPQPVRPQKGIHLREPLPSE
jgi:hypothetical protein